MELESENIEHVVLPVQHETAFPPGYMPVHMAVRGPARIYPFELDHFQQEAIVCLDHGESVLVAAHTSAGKTVVAEYAIATALRDHQRVIYTSPIKALSNQKYRELTDAFSDVGLLTGDVTLNSCASLLVMTTEILRSMLYRGSEILSEVSWVVFDEIHYMRDAERGVVWEETLVLLPDAVKFVFLSATIPNALQFASWVCGLHNQPVHVVRTEYRPTPLLHYIATSESDGIHLIVDANGSFRPAAMESTGPKGNGSRVSSHGPRREVSLLQRIVRMLVERRLYPAIVFSFARRECESNALQLSALDLTNADEKTLIDGVFSRAVASLPAVDRALPQVASLGPLLRRGIGLHHSGLLPVAREVVELLFQESLLKVLFATETFAIGLNMPARTAVFTSLRKFDGTKFRLLTPGEYVQMSGRAGRRGLDTKGLSIVLLSEEAPAGEELRMILAGKTEPLHSAFRLSSSMILNMLRVEGHRPERLLENSFLVFEERDRREWMKGRIEELKSVLKKICGDDIDESELGETVERLEEIERDVGKMLGKVVQPFLQPGRLVRIKEEREWEENEKEVLKMVEAVDCEGVLGMEGWRYTWGAVVGLQGKGMVDVFVGSGIMPVELERLLSVSALRVIMPLDLRGSEGKVVLEGSIRDIERRFGDEGIPLLSAEDLKIVDREMANLLRKHEVLEAKCKSLDYWSTFLARVRRCVEKRIERLGGDAMGRSQTEELNLRLGVLGELGFLSPGEIVTAKGRVACEISAGDELVLSEMIFEGVFRDLDIEQTVTLLSCFVYGEKSSEEEPRIQGVLRDAFNVLKRIAMRIGRTIHDRGIRLEVDDYVSSFRPDMMEIIYAWMKGAKFSQICKMTEIYEGSIVRCMRRLEELVRQMHSASLTIGSAELAEKFSSGLDILKRDIVFANSLYI